MTPEQMAAVHQLALYQERLCHEHEADMQAIRYAQNRLKYGNIATVIDDLDKHMRATEKTQFSRPEQQQERLDALRRTQLFLHKTLAWWYGNKDT